VLGGVPIGADRGPFTGRLSEVHQALIPDLHWGPGSVLKHKGYPVASAASTTEKPSPSRVAITLLRWSARLHADLIRHSNCPRHQYS
jgi:hypothetical protein